MADLDKQFQVYKSNISVSNSKETSLRTSRDNIRDTIKEYFSKELSIAKPKFWQQGSFSFRTMIRPIDGEIDVDDGIYLQHLSSEKSDWPKTKEIRQLLLDAVEDVTNSKPEDKSNCVRVIYKNDYHIDLPIYAESKGTYYLSTYSDGDGWIPSDPKALKDWFYNKKGILGAQLQPCIKYLKAWGDFVSCDLTGIMYTILSAEHLHVKEDRDDICFVKTVENIVNHLTIYQTIKRPVIPYEDLIDSWSKNKIDRVISQLEKLRDKGKDALNESNNKKANEILQSLLGDRFPDSDEEEYSKNTAPNIILVKENTPKPWRL
ncbi:cyclic GMP-AMP synthase DncV-like nucleotidyltransferase [Leptospira noguchii]|uniref:cyclic GMP-AMP synthase DncV-like nucleotidyltransferase n=1 Tax=Leptospira noguchii TaxID=28182 RepID=UPI0011467D01|nr:hypothetical protein [Leptospira noguchii]TQE72763.1 hypothetical protein FF021_13440 [Leptospira noguchii]UOG53238.1 hypothetical protein MAL09_03335 [Leptospira noguchii]